MVDIISRKDGPRREDAAAKRMIDANRATITHLADRLTQGGYSAGIAAKKAAAAPLPSSGRLIHDLAPGERRRADGGKPHIKVSLNDRVVVYDGDSGRQLHLLGMIRHEAGTRYFALATKENGFISTLPDDVLGPLAELDGQIIDKACPESLLAEEIAERLGYA